MSRLRRWRPRPWRHWTLRSRMVTLTVVLTGLALVVVNLVGVTLLNRYLTGSVVDEVGKISRFGDGPIRPGLPTRPSGTGENPSATASPRAGDGDLPPIAEGIGDRALYRVYLPDGTVVADQTNIPDEDLPDLGDFTEISGHLGTGPYIVSGGDGRYVAEVAQRRGGRIVVAALALDRVDAIVDRVLVIGLAASGIVLLGLGAAAASVVRIGLRPLTRMEGAAAEIAGGDLTARIPDTDPHTEPGRLGLALNTMLGRVEAAVAARTASEQRLRQFLADASHELRTPLTSIRGFAELYRRGGARPGPELDETMSRIEHEAARMGLLVEDLLLLASLDEERPLQPSRVDLLAVAADTVRDAHVRSPGRAVELAGFEPVTVTGDDHRLRQVAANLLANALQHTPADARVTFRVVHRPPGPPVEVSADRGGPPVVAAVGADLARDADVAVWEISDTGPGVPVEHAEGIFERLYRADPHRARTHGGAGLGLAIAAAIVKAHGGRIELATAPGAGATFRVLLPIT